MKLLLINCFYLTSAHHWKICMMNILLEQNEGHMTIMSSHKLVMILVFIWRMEKRLGIVAADDNHCDKCL